MFRVLNECYGYDGTCCRKIWVGAEKLFYHETLALIKTFKDDKVERLIDIVAACSKDSQNVKALERIAALERKFRWAIKKVPALEKLSSTSLASLADIIEEIAKPANDWALNDFATNDEWDLFDFKRYLETQGKQQGDLPLEQQKELEKKLDDILRNNIPLRQVFEKV